jgi:hypothetical protein
MIPLLVSEKIWYYIFRQNIADFREKIADVNKQYHTHYEFINGMLLLRFGDFPKWFYFNNRWLLSADPNIINPRIYKPKFHTNTLENIERLINKYIFSITWEHPKHIREDVGPLPENYWYSSGKNSPNGYF